MCGINCLQDLIKTTHRLPSCYPVSFPSDALSFCPARKSVVMALFRVDGFRAGLSIMPYGSRRTNAIGGSQHEVGCERRGNHRSLRHGYTGTEVLHTLKTES